MRKIVIGGIGSGIKVRFYSEYMFLLFKLNSAIDRKVFDYFCVISEYNTGAVRLPTPDRERLLETLGIGSQYLTNSIKRLRDAGLISGERGLFAINPCLMWKGNDWKRREFIKAGGWDSLIKNKIESEFKNSDSEFD